MRTTHRCRCWRRATAARRPGASGPTFAMIGRVAPTPAVWFAYTPDRRGEHPQRHLAHFAGVLQADAARRKIHDLHAVRPNAVTEEALRRIGALYEIEEQIRGKPPDERHSMRQARAIPLLDDMKRWFDATLTTLSSKSDTTKAIQYALNC
nr:transposase [Burkholderia anthina]